MKYRGHGGANNGELIRVTHSTNASLQCIIRVTLGHPDDEPFFAPNDKKRNEEVGDGVVAWWLYNTGCR